jgi:hypothetical protein
MSSKGLHESEMGTEYIHFHKANDDRSMGLFFKCGGGEGGKGDAVVGKEDKSLEFRLAQSKSNADFHTRDPSKLVAAVSVSGWKKLRCLLCLLHSLRIVGHTYSA